MTSDLEARLRAVSLRVTRSRVAVLAALRDHPHVDTHTVIALVRADHHAVSHQAIYDVLQSLTDAGLVRRASSPPARPPTTSPEWATTTTMSCAALAVRSRTSTCAVGPAPCLTAPNDHGFVVDEAEVVYWGTCPDCAAGDTPMIRSSSEGSR